MDTDVQSLLSWSLKPAQKVTVVTQKKICYGDATESNEGNVHSCALFQSVTFLAAAFLPFTGPITSLLSV